MARRKQREITELLRREISNIILCELADPRLGFVTLTRVHLAGDFRSAKVFVTVRGSSAELHRTLEGLKHARGRIQALVAQRLKLCYTPLLQFVEDQELHRALRVDKLIEDIRKQNLEP